MRLKRLELQGYKTFASRTEFLFESGITAIVGPNGSGKSNIADAVRWVLGEQSYRLLRGKKTEDMIFAGSQRRVRSGMAQATLVLDNADEWLPVEFSEVAIGRRAYRSGENEYLLNGKRIRLRDTSELLGAGGLGQRAYNVVGQGLVDAALSLRADERRALFEEAAGIAYYKERRQETLNKLEATERNLERVTDIINEIKPRLRRLRRQAARSEEHTQVTADLENLLYVWYGYHWEQAKVSLREVRENAALNRGQLEQAREKQADLEESLSEMRQKASQLRVHLGEWHSRNSVLHSRAEEIQRSIAVSTERIRHLKLRHEELGAEIEHLNQRKLLLDEQLEQAQGNLTNASAKLSDQKERVDSVKAALSTRNDSLVELEESLRSAQQEWVRLEERISLQEKAEDDTSQRSVRVQAEIENEQDTLAQQKATRENAKGNVAKLDIILSDFSSAVSELGQERDRIKSEIARIEETLDDHTTKLRSAESQAAKLSARYHALLEIRDSVADMEPGVKSVMESGDPGVIEPLVRLLEIPEEYESAINSAVGPILSAIVVKDWATVKRLLSKVEQDRIRLLPLSVVRPTRPIKAPKNNHVVGVASDLVRVDSEYKPLIDLLLGQVIVVSDRDTAAEIASDLPIGSKAVALDGFVVSQGGMIDRPGKDSKSVLLAQEREWKALPEKLQKAEERLDELVEVKNINRQERDRLADLLAQIEQSFQEKQRQQRDSEKQREQELLELERSQQLIEWHVQRIADLEKEAETLIEHRNSNSAQLEHVENRRQELSQAIVGLEESLSQARIPAEDLSAQLADLERSLAQMEGSHQNLKSVLDVRRDASGQITEQIEDRKQRLDAVENETSQLESLQKNERVQEQDISQELDEARKQIKPAEDQLSEAEEAINSRLEIEASLRRQVRTAEQDSSQAELSLHRQQDQLDHLRDRIAEELGLVDLPLEEDIDGQNPLPMGEIIGQLPFVKELPKGIEETIQVRRQQLRRMGLINPAAPREFHELSQRYEFLDQQMTDLEEASKKLKQVIDELDVVMEREFNRTFNAVATEFKAAFTRLFAGGSARLVLTDPDSPINSGVEIIARPPGRRQQGLALLSGGERSLTAAALIFALLKVSPTPFCVLDEVDAMLDEANISRFRDMLKELSENTQFIIITHNRGTVVAADTIYGVSMGDDGVSQVMSLRLEGEDIK